MVRGVGSGHAGPDTRDTQVTGVTEGPQCAAARHSWRTSWAVPSHAAGRAFRRRGNGGPTVLTTSSARSSRSPALVLLLSATCSLLAGAVVLAGPAAAIEDP